VIVNVAIEDIVVTGRHRVAMGNIAELAESIESVGLIAPVAITPDYRLIAGARRLAAAEYLGWQTVPVVVLSDLSEASDLLIAERDENTMRLPMAVSELVSLGRALEELERPKARERMRTSTSFGVSSVELTPPSNKQTREVVGEALGVSGPTYQRMKMVVTAAEDASLPEPVREVAQQAKEQMDAGGSIHAAYDRVQAAKEAIPPTPPIHAASNPVPKLHRIRAAEVLSNVATQLRGITIALDGLDFADVEASEADRKALDKGIQALSRLRKSLRN
jgi:ParB family chromosome partitioning protein